MKLTLNRFASFPDSTLGCLSVNGVPECFTLEDEYRAVKVKGETRIPAGTYEIKFRKVDSPKTLKYRNRYHWFTYHLELQDVPEFKYVYIHIGNHESDSEGCILVGTGSTIGEFEQSVSHSVTAFTHLYEDISEALDCGESVTIEVK